MTQRVCLSFDFDAFSASIRQGHLSPTQLSRDEFAAVGTRRILALLEREEILSTWFIPGHTLDTYPDLCRQIHSNGHEIAHHGYLHEPPGLMSRAEEDNVLVRGNEAIARVTGRQARGYRSPSWDLSAHSVDLLISHGFLYDSSLMADDYSPYFVRSGDQFPPDGPPIWGQTTSLVELPVSWSLDDYPHFEYVAGRLPGLRSASAVLENFMEDYNYMAEVTESGILTYTFHPEVIGRGHRMRMLATLIQRLRLQGARFTRMDEVAVELQPPQPHDRE
jgi:peptidoglycan/xylan/chitin deacetylase (PgdA/CDA1 family)